MERSCVERSIVFIITSIFYISLCIIIFILCVILHASVTFLCNRSHNMNYQLTKDALPLFNSPEKSTFSPVNDVCFTTRSTHLPRTLRMYSTRVPPAKGAVRHLRSSRLRRTAPCVAWLGRQPSRPAITSVRTTDEPTVMPSVRNLPGSGRRPACCRRRTYRRRWKPSSDHARR